MRILNEEDRPAVTALIMVTNGTNLSGKLNILNSLRERLPGPLGETRPDTGRIRGTRPQSGRSKDNGNA